MFVKQNKNQPYFDGLYNLYHPCMVQIRDGLYIIALYSHFNITMEIPVLPIINNQKPLQPIINHFIYLYIDIIHIYIYIHIQNNLLTSTLW